MKFAHLALCSLLLGPWAHADIASPQPKIAVPTPHKAQPAKPLPKQPQPQVPATTDSPRDPVSVARKTPAIAERIAKLKGASAGLYNDQAGAQLDEKVTVIELDGQCGFAGCSSTSLVVFTYRTRGANTATSSVMAMVSCPPIMQKGCTAAVAEVRPQGQLEQTR